MKINASSRLLKAKMNVDNEDMVDLINSLFGTEFDPSIYNYDGAPAFKKAQKQYAQGISPVNCHKKFMKLLARVNSYVDDGYYDEDGTQYAERFSINNWTYLISFKPSSIGTLIVLDIIRTDLSLNELLDGYY